MMVQLQTCENTSASLLTLQPGFKPLLQPMCGAKAPGHTPSSPPAVLTQTSSLQTPTPRLQRRTEHELQT